MLASSPPSPMALDTFTALDDWLNLDQAGDSIGLSDTPQDTSPLRTLTFDPHDPAPAFSLEALIQTAGSEASPFAAVDPAALLGLAGPLSLPSPPSPSALASVASPVAAQRGDVYAGEPSAPTISSSPSSLPFAVDPNLTAPIPPRRPASDVVSSQSTDQGLSISNRPCDVIVERICEDDDDCDDADSAPLPAKKPQSHPHALVDVPDWADRPTAEEYKKLSSKEKRQLRNKISARNFRHRRKEHISTLEQQVAQRDEVIALLRNDLGAVKAENTQLRTEVDQLKMKWADLLKKIDEMSINATSSSPPSSTSSPASATRPRPSSVIPKPNLFKDIGSHSMKAFHGAAGLPNSNGSVHTAYVVCA